MEIYQKGITQKIIPHGKKVVYGFEQDGGVLKDKQGAPLGIVAENTGKNEITVTGSYLPDELPKNSGIGTEVYKQIADSAIAQGKSLWSDESVTGAARSVWEKLSEWYDVKFVPERNQYRITRKISKK